jgi:hypothetical protein
VLYRLSLRWEHYIRGVRERYKLLMSPMHRGFFIPWLAYAIFVAVAFRWQTDLLLLLILTLRHCVTPATDRLQREGLYLPFAMALAIIVMTIALLPVQKGYLRAIPAWIGEALITLLPISVILTLIGLAFYWVDFKYACGG